MPINVMEDLSSGKIDRPALTECILSILTH